MKLPPKGGGFTPPKAGQYIVVKIKKPNTQMSVRDRCLVMQQWFFYLRLHKGRYTILSQANSSGVSLGARQIILFFAFAKYLVYSPLLLLRGHRARTL